jgi:hypothetical protein
MRRNLSEGPGHITTTAMNLRLHLRSYYAAPSGSGELATMVYPNNEAEGILLNGLRGLVDEIQDPQNAGEYYKEAQSMRFKTPEMATRVAKTLNFLPNILPLSLKAKALVIAAKEANV